MSRDEGSGIFPGCVIFVSSNGGGGQSTWPDVGQCIDDGVPALPERFNQHYHDIVELFDSCK